MDIEIHKVLPCKVDPWDYKGGGYDDFALQIVVLSRNLTKEQLLYEDEMLSHPSSITYIFSVYYSFFFMLSLAGSGCRQR